MKFGEELTMAVNALYNPVYANSRALVVGINTYRHAPPLEYARNDAEAIAEVLVSQFNFPQSNVSLLLDEEATYEAIRNSFFRLSDADPDDRVLFFFAGHGHTATGRRGEVGFLVPVEGRPDQLATLVRWNDLTTNAEFIPAKHIFFLMDACYGGLALPRRLAPGSARFMKDMLQRYSRQVLTAGKGDEVVSDANGTRPGHSIFTSHVLDALDGAAARKDGIVTANSLMGYVHEKVGADPQSLQTPHFGYVEGDGDFIFNPEPIIALAQDEQTDKDVLVQVSSYGSQMESSDQSTTQRLKRLLSDPRERIALDDFIASHVRHAIEGLAPEKYPLSPDVGKDEFAARLQAYEQATADLRAIVILLARWASEDQLPLLEKTLLRLGEIERPGSGKVVWIGLSWYPIQLLMYSAGIAAISNNRFDVLRTILLAKLRMEGRASGFPNTALVVLVTEGLIRTWDGFKLLPGHERQFVPVSEYLHKFLQPEIEDALFLGRQL